MNGEANEVGVSGSAYNGHARAWPCATTRNVVASRCVYCTWPKPRNRNRRVMQFLGTGTNNIAGHAIDNAAFCTKVCRACMIYRVDSLSISTRVKIWRWTTNCEATDVQRILSLSFLELDSHSRVKQLEMDGILREYHAIY